MNRERIKILAHLLRKSYEPESKPKIGFNLGTYKAMGGRVLDRSGHNCNTVACIAGWTVAAFGYPGEFTRVDDTGFSNDACMKIQNSAMKLLDLDVDCADRLFCPAHPLGNPMSDINPVEAASCLEHLADTGTLPDNWR